MKFVDIKNDIAFRKIFGNENRKETLISFLNAVLDFQEQHRIIEVNILNPYQLPKLKGGKVTIIDIKATDQQGRTYIVEMQVGNLDGFAKRVLYYSAKSYSDQIKRADFYRKLRPVIFIGILDFEHTNNPNFISRHQIRDVETGEQTIKDMEFNFIELPKFNKELKDLSTLTDKWIYFIKNAEDLEVVPDDINDEGLKSAYEEANIQTWTQEELDAYDYTFMREEDERARLDKAKQEAERRGEKRGEQRGEKRGEDRKEKETVLKPYINGKSAEQIADFLDIPMERVQQIINEYEKHKK
jgi:predicted transposase/invertase (TIGR01784 family)